MAIKNIKEIINNKGYVIKPQDRKIFEEGDLQSFFGLSRTDAVEFIIYDVNDNQLPQLDGKLVRYISLTDENIRDYFLIPEGTLVQKNQLPTEYFIDVERLLNEAGYKNGIFKTQITLVNKRAGSEKEFDKLWIQEVSPSRTEVRLFPLKKGVEINPELQARFNIFVNGGQFRDDVIQSIFEFVEQIDPTKISQFLKGKYGEKWLKTFITEFKIESIESLITKIYESFIKSVNYEFTNRFSKIGEFNYGTPKSTIPNISLSKDEATNIIKRILAETIEYYLPQRDVDTTTKTSDEFDESTDEAADIILREDADTIITAEKVDIVENTVVKINNPIEEKHIQEVVKEIKKLPIISKSDKQPSVVTPDDEPDLILTDGSVVLDYNNVNEAALGEIINNTNEQTNKESTKQFFEDLNNKGLNTGLGGLDPGTSTQAGSGGVGIVSAEEFDNLTANDRRNLGRASSVVIDGKVQKRQKNQL